MYFETASQDALIVSCCLLLVLSGALVLVRSLEWFMSECFAGLQANLIYIYRIPDETHEGCLKIGKTTIDGRYLDYAPNSEPLKARALKRIKQQTQTAGVKAELLHREIAYMKPIHGAALAFRYTDVHNVLVHSGIHPAHSGRE